MKVRITLVHLALVLVLVPLADAAASGPQTRTLLLPMENYDGHFREHCMDLQAGDKLEMRVQAPHPVRLNIHHHENAHTTFLLDEIIEGARRSAIRIANAGEYCIEVMNTESRPSTFEVRLDLRLSSG